METTVNERVIMLKNQLNLTVDDFCLKAKLSRTTLWNIQNGGEMKPKTTNAICDAFNVNKDWLLHGKGIMFLEAPKTEINNNVVDPWKDALVSQIASERDSLKKEVERLWQMISHFSSGAKPNFLKVSEYAYSSLLLPNRKTFNTASGTKVC